jgi:hypothetical protein
MQHSFMSSVFRNLSRPGISPRRFGEMARMITLPRGLNTSNSYAAAAAACSQQYPNHRNESQFSATPSCESPNTRNATQTDRFQLPIFCIPYLYHALAASLQMPGTPRKLTDFNCQFFASLICITFLFPPVWHVGELTCIHPPPAFDIWEKIGFSARS